MDDEGIERGTIGKHICAILSKVKSADSALAELALDESASPVVRERALILHCGVKGGASMPLLRRLSSDALLRRIAVDLIKAVKA
jgi:hypothetical protein